ncbi:MFS transporter [Swingsia samuiensis]
MTAALLAPFWGRLSDRYGARVNLLRASFGMLISMTLTSFARTPLELLLCRSLVGIAGGYTSGAARLIAKRKNNKGGLAQGMFSSSIFLGSLIGPPLGSWFSQFFGMEGALRLTAAMILFNCAATCFLSQDTENSSTQQRKLSPFDKSYFKFAVIYMTVIAIVMAASVSIEPNISTYVMIYGHTDNVIKGAGFALAAIAVASIVSATIFGYLGDKIGYKAVIAFGLITGSVILILHAFVETLWEIVAIRFCLGLALGGIIPCIRAYIKMAFKPDSVGSLIGLTTSAQYIGQVVGPVSAGLIAARWGLNPVFYITGIFVILGALLVCCDRQRITAC